MYITIKMNVSIFKKFWLTLTESKKMVCPSFSFEMRNLKSGVSVTISSFKRFYVSI